MIFFSRSRLFIILILLGLSDVIIHDFGLLLWGLGKSINFETQDFVPGDDNVGLPNTKEGFWFSTIFATYRFLGVKTLNLFGEGDQPGLIENVLSSIHKK